MHQESCMNYGWHGPAFVNRLIGLDERQITDKYEEMLKYVSEIADGKSGSHVSGISAVALADAMIDSWFFQHSDVNNVDNSMEEQRDVDNPLDILPESWERAKQMAAAILKEQVNSDVGDVNENALQFVVDWVLQNRLFFGEKAIGTCLGKFSESGNTVYIFPSALNQALTKAGYSPRKTLKYMADRGLIASAERKDHKGKIYQVVKRFDNRSCRFVQFSIGKLSEKEDAIDIEDDETAPSAAQKDSDGFTPVQEKFDLPFN